MRHTIYLKAFNNFNNHFHKTPIILGSYNYYSKFLGQNKVKFLSKRVAPTNFLLQPMIFQIPAHSTSFRFETTSLKDAKNKDQESEKTNSDNPSPENTVVTENSRKEKLKKAIKEYGSTVIVFHVAISLISLGSSYLVVSTGLDISWLFETMGISEWLSSETAANAGTFAVAYAVHKLFAPLRITITLASVPFIVKYLRKIGFLKK